MSLAALLSCSAGLLNRGSWGPIALCWVLVLSTASYLQLTKPVCCTRLYNCLIPTCFLWASHLHPIQPVHSQGYTPDIFDRMHLYLDWRLGQRSICYSISTFKSECNKCDWSSDSLMMFQSSILATTWQGLPSTNLRLLLVSTTVKCLKNISPFWCRAFGKKSDGWNALLTLK